MHRAITSDEIAQAVGIMPLRMNPERLAFVCAALGGTPEHISMSFGCDCGERLRVFDAKTRTEARTCAVGLGWRIAERTGVPQCPACTAAGFVPRFGSWGADGTNYRPLVCPLVDGITERERWVFIGALDVAPLLARAADCVCSIVQHVVNRGISAPRECAETHRVAMRLLEGRAEFWPAQKEE